MQSVGGRVEQAGGLYLHHFIDSPFGIEGASRNDHTAQFFGRIVPLPKGDVDIVAKGVVQNYQKSKTSLRECVDRTIKFKIVKFLKMTSLNSMCL